MSSYPDKIRASWQLLCRSLSVLQQNPKLFLFPVVNLLCAIGILVFFFAPILIAVVATAWTGPAMAHVDWKELTAQYRGGVVYVWTAALYMTSMFVGAFVNVAFYHEIFRAFNGERVSIGYGLRFAAARWRAILMWSLLAATVGLIIRAIEERVGWLGKLVMAAVGTVWSVAAVFAIPVIIRRADANPFAVLRDSVATLKRSWGESLVGWIGIQLGGTIFLVLSVGLLVPALILASGLHVFGVIFVAFGVWLLALVVASFLIGMANHVYRCALYIYASEGVVPEAYTPDMMNLAWKVKKAKA